MSEFSAENFGTPGAGLRAVPISHGVALSPRLYLVGQVLGALGYDNWLSASRLEGVHDVARYAVALADACIDAMNGRRTFAAGPSGSVPQMEQWVCTKCMSPMVRSEYGYTKRMVCTNPACNYECEFNG